MEEMMDRLSDYLNEPTDGWKNGCIDRLTAEVINEWTDRRGSSGTHTDCK